VNTETTTDRPKPPDDLDGEALLEWHRVCDELADAGRLDKIDRAILTVYATTWAVHQSVGKHVAKFGAVSDAYPSLGDYTAAVNAGWPDDPGSTLGSGPMACGGFDANHPFADPTRWTAGPSGLVARVRTKYTVGSSSGPALPHKYGVFVFAYCPFGPTLTFHAHGDAVTENDWTEYPGTGIVSTSTGVTDWVGSVAGPPDVPPQNYFPTPTEGVNFFNNWGWSAKHVLGVHKWNVAGGLTTCTVTD
jgi:hypothetical protein